MFKVWVSPEAIKQLDGDHPCARADKTKHWI